MLLPIRDSNTNTEEPKKPPYMKEAWLRDLAYSLDILRRN